MIKNPASSKQAIFLIKFFSEKKHCLAFKDGCSMFRTPHYYRTHDDIGGADRSESCLGYWDTRLGDKLPNLSVDVDMKGATSVLIYPTHEQQDAWLQSWCVIGPHNEFEQSLERMLEAFGTYFVLLPAENIDAYAKLIEQASGLQVRYGIIQYSDNPLDRSLIVKDSKFAYQKEFRFFVGECPKDEVQDKPLELQGVNKMLLGATTLRLESSSGENKYFSLGHQKVVTA